jgi:hypothetical protein
MTVQLQLISSPIVTTWKELLGDQLIPYDKNDRKRIFTATYGHRI